MVEMAHVVWPGVALFVGAIQALRPGDRFISHITKIVVHASRRMDGSRSISIMAQACTWSVKAGGEQAVRPSVHRSPGWDPGAL